MGDRRLEKMLLLEYVRGKGSGDKQMVMEAMRQKAETMVKGSDLSSGPWKLMGKSIRLGIVGTGR